MLWFEKLVGFKEESPEQVRKQINLEGNTLKSLVNGETYQMGLLEIPSLAELRARNKLSLSSDSRLNLSEVVGDVQDFHQMPENQGALFQAASQFNLLEMVNPKIRPEDGIGRYDYDKTQGPACAIACGAGTIYRNYFVEIDGAIGQTGGHQIDCLEEIGKYFNNEHLELWQMQNGYALANTEGLKFIGDKIRNLSNTQYEELKGLLKVGIQWDTEVTISWNKQIVSQIYCSGLPVNYSFADPDLWQEFAQLILEATYEATLHTALINKEKTGNDKVYLTLVGGGVFGNKEDWIKAAILKNLRKFSNATLDIRFVSYGASNPLVGEIIEAFSY